MRLPLRERLGRDPQRQTPPAAQARFVLGPVRHAMRHLRDVTSAIGVVFVRIASLQERSGCHFITQPFVRLSAHQRPFGGYT